MKVILLQDVAKMGRRYETVDVPDGYALNMLIPKGLAEAATPENIKKMSARSSKAEAEREKEDAAFDAAVADLKDKTITVAVELNEQGHMFEALKASVVVAAIAAEGVTLAEDQIVIGEAIKEQGEHTVQIASGTKSENITISVVAK